MSQVRVLAGWPAPTVALGLARVGLPDGPHLVGPGLAQACTHPAGPTISYGTLRTSTRTVRPCCCMVRYSYGTLTMYAYRTSTVRYRYGTVRYCRRLENDDEGSAKMQRPSDRLRGCSHRGERAQIVLRTSLEDPARTVSLRGIL